MERKYIMKTIAIFSLLIAILLGGCGTGGDSSGKKNGETAGAIVPASEKADGENAAAPGREGEAKSEPAPSQAEETKEEAVQPATGDSGQGNPTASQEKDKPAGDSGQAAPEPSAGTGSAGGTKSSSGSAADPAASASKPAPAAPAPKPASKPAPAPAASTATISIKGPADAGTILNAAEVELKEGDSVIDVLLRAAKKKGLFVDYSGSGATAYVSGIDNYYEFDYGPKSGWICKKNGAGIQKGAGSVKVAKGDTIEWVYTEDFVKEQ